MTVDHELPRLSSAELLARYGGDEVALRRYRMLNALLREGRSAAEVARAFGVSRESVRRVYHAFARQGLEGLQSRKPGGGHVARGTALATIIRQELNADPGVPAAVLWRRVQARLQEIGAPAPRSTFYRLLAHVRDAELTGAQGTTPAGLLREALDRFAEDPPVALGRSGLASLLLPNVREALSRGRWLQRAMRLAIERLRPTEAGPVLDDPRWRHYLIIAGEYEVGDSRADLQQSLALSASTYSRAKREALERLAALLPEVVAELPPPAPPSTLIDPPPAPELFDYEAELERYAARLRRDGVIVIWGPDGAGKTALSAVLAARLRSRGQKVVWHTGKPPELEPNPGYALLLTLAAALNLDGHPALWEQMSDPEQEPFVQWLDLLLTGLTERHWTVVIDNAHRLVGEQADRVLDLLLAARERRDLRLVWVSRDLPLWADAERWLPLPTPDDTSARNALIARLDTQDVPQPAHTGMQLQLLQNRINDVLAVVGSPNAAGLTAEQAAQVLELLHPFEHIAEQLRARMRGD
jgi:transposase